MNDLDICLDVVSSSRQPLRYIDDLTLNISETVRDRTVSEIFKGPPIGNGTWAIEWSRDR